MHRVARGRRIALFVEGETERQSLSEFFHRWLDPQLPQGSRVGIQPVKFSGSGDYIENVAARVELYLSEKQVDFIVGIVDLYGLPDTIDLSRQTTVKDKVRAARKQIKGFVPAEFQSRFHQHFAVHELEAWMLAYPEKWPRSIRSEIQKRPPEIVNFDEPPAKFVKRLLRGDYKKTVMGRNILRTADPQIAIDKCPYLKLLAEDLLRIARELA